MRERYLEVALHTGKPFATYLYLCRETDIKSVRTVEIAPGILVDYAPSGEPIGLETITPAHATVEQINTP